MKEFLNFRNLEMSEMVMRLFLVMVVLAGTFGACAPLLDKVGLREDSPGEEFLEDLVEDHLGYQIDLTPESEED